MTMFEFDSANHTRNFVKRAKAGRPVGNSKAGIVAGYESTGYHKKKCKAGHYDCKPMMSGVIPGRIQSCSNPVNKNLFCRATAKTSQVH